MKKNKETLIVPIDDGENVARLSESEPWPQRSGQAIMISRGDACSTISQGTKPPLWFRCLTKKVISNKNQRRMDERAKRPPLMELAPDIRRLMIKAIDTAEVGKPFEFGYRSPDYEVRAPPISRATGMNTPVCSMILTTASS